MNGSSIFPNVGDCLFYTSEKGIALLDRCKLKDGQKVARNL